MKEAIYFPKCIVYRHLVVLIIHFYAKVFLHKCNFTQQYSIIDLNFLINFVFYLVCSFYNRLSAAKLKLPLQIASNFTYFYLFSLLKGWGINFKVWKEAKVIDLFTELIIRSNGSNRLITLNFS